LFGDLPAGDASAEPAQLAALTPKTKTMTLTIGGNDVGFSPVFSDCVYSPVQLPEVQALIPGSPGCQQRLDAGLSARIANLAGQADPADFAPSVPYAQILTAIHARAPKAEIYFTGYPELFGTSYASPAGCLVGQLGQIPLYIAGSDALWIRAKTVDLNAAIQGSVAAARQFGIRAHYVDVAKKFAGHGLCDAHPSWVNGVVLAPTNPPQPGPASFHPTARGFRAYADAVSYTVRCLSVSHARHVP
jgi:GDSL-like Lipase/Acylhydrolase family